VGIEIENGSCDPEHAHFGGGLSSKSYDLIRSTCVLKLTIPALAVPEILLGAPEVGHVTLNMSLLRVICPAYVAT